MPRTEFRQVTDEQLAAIRRHQPDLALLATEPVRRGATREEFQADRTRYLDAAKAMNERAANEKRDLSDSEATAFDGLVSLAHNLNISAERAAPIPIPRGVTRIPGDGSWMGGLTGDGWSGPASPEQNARDASMREFSDVAVAPGESFTEHLQSRGQLRSNGSLAGDVGLGHVMRAMVLGPRNEAERRALSEGTDSAGGFTVPDMVSAQVIDRMRAASHVIRAGALTVPLESDKTTVARIASDPTATWRVENAAVNVADPVFEGVVFTARSLAVLVKASRELLEDSVNIEAAMQVVLANSMATEIDRVALVGTGTAPEPRGVANTAGVGSVSMGTNGAALTSYDKVLDLLQTLADANAPTPTAAIMAPRTGTALGKLKDTTGQPLSRPGALATLPFLETTQIGVADTQGSATTASRIIAGNFPQLMIGVRSQLRVEVLRELFAGNLQYAFLAFLRVDVQLAHPGAFAQLIGIIP